MFGFGNKMKLIKIPLKNMNTGSPMPVVLEGNSGSLYVLFYAGVEDGIIVVIKFFRVSIYKYGTPDDEVLHGHPYYKLGLGFYSFSELKNSDWIEELIKINSVHAQFNKKNWKNCRHFILTFKDQTFECVADDYEIMEENISMKDKAFQIMNEYFTSQ